MKYLSLCVWIILLTGFSVLPVFLQTTLLHSFFWLLPYLYPLFLISLETLHRQDAETPEGSVGLGMVEALACSPLALS
jgi:hypothetical protein